MFYIKHKRGQIYILTTIEIVQYAFKRIDIMQKPTYPITASWLPSDFVSLISL